MVLTGQISVGLTIKVKDGGIMKKIIILIVMLGMFTIVLAKTTRVTTGVGKVTIKESSWGTDYIKIRCNNGLVIEADWERDSNISGFGYDLIDVRVNENYNKMAVYMTVRGCIVKYLNGEYR